MAVLFSLVWSFFPHTGARARQGTFIPAVISSAAVHAMLAAWVGEPHRIGREWSGLWAEVTFAD